MSYPTVDGWSYNNSGWSYAKGYWSYDSVDNWSFQSYVPYSYPAGWSVNSGWSFPRTFAIEAEHIDARQVVLTSYLSAWWLNAVDRGVDGTSRTTHPATARVAPVSYGTLHTHPNAHGFNAFRLNNMLSPWVGQVAKGYTPNRRHIISFYAWIDEESEQDGELYIEGDWAPNTDTLVNREDYVDSRWNGTWAAQSNSVWKRQAPDGTVDNSRTVVAGGGKYRFWVTVPPRASGSSFRYRARTDSNTFLWVDQVKHEPEKPKDMGIVSSGGNDWLECDGKQWSTNQWKDKLVVITGGVSGTPFTRTIESNTYNRLYITTPWGTGSGLSAGVTFDIVGVVGDARPTAYVDEGMSSQWIASIRAEDIRGGLLTLGGSTVSGAVGGARLRVLSETDEELIVIGENTSGDGYRGVDLKNGSGVRIADGSGGKFEIGDNIQVTEEGIFCWNDGGAQVVAIRSKGEDRFTFSTASEWKQRINWSERKGWQMFDDADIPYVSFNPQTGHCYIGRENEPNIHVPPVGQVEIHGGLLVDGTVGADAIVANSITAEKIAAGTITTTEIAAGTIVAGNIAANTITAGNLNVSTLSAITADMGSLTSGDITIDDEGFIKSSGVTFNTGAQNWSGNGFWLGYDSTVGELNYKWMVGNNSGNYSRIYFDGSNVYLNNLYLGGGLNLAVTGNSGSIKCGKTAYGSGTGYILEYNSGTPRMDIGNSTYWLRWTGTAVDISGKLTAGDIVLDPVTPSSGRLYLGTPYFEYVGASTAVKMYSGDFYVVDGSVTCEALVIEGHGTVIDTSNVADFAAIQINDTTVLDSNKDLYNIRYFTCSSKAIVGSLQISEAFTNSTVSANYYYTIYDTNGAGYRVNCYKIP